jgi:hypothetical protein
MLADSANQYLETFAPPETKENKPLATVLELNFTTLRFEAVQGAKLADYEIAHKAANLEGKWRSANNILRNNNATIKDRYYGEGYLYSYWLYGEDKIYRQKIKSKPTS